jgi:hypothetical protein
MFDIGSQRFKGKKQMHCFKSVTTIPVFCAALSEYNQILLEESKLVSLMVIPLVVLFDEPVYRATESRGGVSCFSRALSIRDGSSTRQSSCSLINLMFLTASCWGFVIHPFTVRCPLCVNYIAITMLIGCIIQPHTSNRYFLI